MNKHLLLSGFILVFLLLITQHTVEELEQDGTSEGQILFKQHCSGCHNLDHQSDFLKNYPALKESALEAWQIAHKIKSEDDKTRKMPTFNQLSESDAQIIADFIKSR